MTSISEASVALPPSSSFLHNKKGSSSSTELTKAILKLSQELSSHKDDHTTVLILKDLRSSIGQVSTVNRETQVLFRTLKEQVDSLFRYTVHHNNPERSQIASECEHLLVDLEPERSVSHLQQLLKYQLKFRDYIAALSVLRELAPKLPAQLQEKLFQYKPGPIDTRERIDEINTISRQALKASQGLPITPQHEQALCILNNRLASHDPSPLEREEAAKVTELICDLWAQPMLIQALKAKKDKNLAENFLLQLARISSQIDQGTATVAKLSAILAKPTAMQASQFASAAHRSLLHLRSSILKSIRVPSAQADPSLIQQLNGILLKLPENEVSWQWIERSESTLTLLKGLLNQLPQNAVPPETLRQIQDIEDRTQHFITKTIPHLKELIQSLRPVDKLSRGDLLVISRFAELENSFSTIRQIAGSAAPSPRFSELSELIQTSAVSMSTLNALFQTLPSYESGDVLLDIEHLQKLPNETKWAKERRYGLLHPLKLFRLIFHWVTRGFSYIKPFFIGKATHASIACTQGGHVFTSELTPNGYQKKALDFRTAMSRVGLRNNLASQLTPEGKELLSKLKPPLQPRDLSSLFIEELDAQEDAYQSRFQLLQPSHQIEWDVFARSLEDIGWAQPFGTELIIGPLASLLRIAGDGVFRIKHAARKIFHKLKHAIQKVPMPPEVEPSNTSIFVAKRLLEAQESAEKRLITLLHSQGLISESKKAQLFYPLMLEAPQQASLTPGNLRSALKDSHYAPIDMPLAMQLVLQKEDIPRQKAEESIPLQIDETKKRASIIAFARTLYDAKRVLVPAAHAHFIPSPDLSPEEALTHVQSSLRHLEPFLSAEPSFTPFFRTATLLIDTFQSDRSVLTELVFPLFTAVLIDGSLQERVSPEKGSGLGAMILFLHAIKQDELQKAITQGKTFPKKMEAIEQKALELFNLVVAASLNGKPGKEQALPIQMAVAQALILPSGRLNLGLLSFLQSVTPAIQTSLASSKNEILDVLKELVSNETLIAKIEAMPTPKPGSSGQRIINASLARAADTPLQPKDPKVVVLGTLLNKWRQKNIGSCHVTCILQQLQDAALHWILDDFSELLSEGALSRTQGGRKIVFYGLERSIPPAKAVLNAGGSTAQDLLTFAQQASTQTPLWRVWENAVASMAFVPSTVMVPDAINPSQREEFLRALQKTIVSAAVAINFKNLPWNVIRSVFRLIFVKNAVSDDPLFESFGKIRFCYAPAQGSTRDFCEWTLAYETKDGLKVAYQDDDVGLFLQQAIQEMLRKAGVAEEKIVEITKASLNPSSLTAIFHNEAPKTLKLPNQRVSLNIFHIAEAYRPLAGKESEKLNVEGISGVKNFLRWAEDQRVIVGSSPSITITVTSEVRPLVGHAFRLLPNHPSVVHCSLEEHSKLADSVFLQKASSFPITCQNISEEISSILAKHKIDGKKAIKEAASALLQKHGPHNLLSLSGHVEAFIDEVENHSKYAFSAVERSRIDIAVLRGLLSDSPSYKASLIHFADTNWASETDGHPVNLDFCFYLNPRTKKWITVAAPATGESYSKIQEYPIHKMLTHRPMSGLITEAGTKHVLLLGKEREDRLHQIEELFILNWHEFTKSAAALSSAEKVKLRERFDALEWIKILDLNPAEKALQQCLIQQQEYERISKDFALEVEPDIAQIRQTTVGEHRDAMLYLQDPQAFRNQVLALI
jgi:hypothetical protein